MKKLKRERSVRILSAAAAEESMSSEAAAVSEAPSPTDFDAYFPWVCARLHEHEATATAAAAAPDAPVIHVRRIFRQEKVSDKIKSAKAKKSVARLAGSTDAVLSPVPSDGANGGAAPLYVGALYDARDRLVEVFIGDVHGGGRGAAVPRIMLRALAVCAPHQSSLARFTVRGILDSHAVRDIADLLPLTTVTELRLDDSRVPHADWYTMLQPPCTLRYLSVCRSHLDDAACSTLASALLTRSSRLALLDLSSNRIGDEGCACLAALLRVDRQLLYLNLSDNRIGDVGCIGLLASLGEFPLACDEIVAERRRRLSVAREKLERLDRDVEAPPISAHESLRSKGKPGMAVASAGAGAVSARKGRPSTVDTGLANGGDTEELEPYALTQTVSHDGYVYCVGNSALVYLNLAYNGLGLSSVRRAIDILRQQIGATAQAAADAAGGAAPAAVRRGLLRIVLEGNPLPPDGSDVPQLEDVLERRLVDAGGVSDKKKGKK